MSNDRGILAYATIASTIGMRIINAKNQLDCDFEDDHAYLSIESAALNIRMICESILLSSFVLHLDAVENLLSSLKRNDSWDKLRKILERENENYMPKPFRSWREEDGVVRIANIEDAHLSGSELFKIWGKASELLHCRNPLQAKTPIQEKARELLSHLYRLTLVMHQHAIAVPADGMLYMVNVSTISRTPEVHWWAASKLDSEGSFLVEEYGSGREK